MAGNITYRLNGGIGALYSFDSLQSTIKRINSWFEQGLINEKECAAFIIQLFHEIPEDMYNDIISKMTEE